MMSNWASGAAAAILFYFSMGAIQAFAYPAVDRVRDNTAAFSSIRFGHGGGFFARHAEGRGAHQNFPRSYFRRKSSQSSHRYHEARVPRFPPRRAGFGDGRRHASGGSDNPSRHPGRGWGGGRGRPQPPGGTVGIWPPIRRLPPPPVIIAGGVPPAAVSIAGFGGERPPIAPRFSRLQGPQASAAVAALLNNKRHRAKELLIEVADDSPAQLRQALTDQYGVEVRELGAVALINARIWQLTLVRDQDLAAVLGRLLQDNRVISAQPNYVYTPVQGTDRSAAVEPAKAALTPPPGDARSGGASVKVAIVDTCIERDHTEIQGEVQAYFDATPSAANACAGENHGTAVASLIGGRGKVHGLASGAALMEARAFTVTEEEKEIAATSREIVLSLDWGAVQGARVVNLSFAGPSDALVERTVAAAYTKGIVLVGAAGNAGPASKPLYPAAYPEVIAVTATDARRGLYSAANRGPYIAVSERGVDVIVAQIHESYGIESGTSFAAATVSGIAAHLIALRPKATPDEIRAALQKTADRLSAKGRDELFGYGLVNASAAARFIEAGASE